MPRVTKMNATSDNDVISEEEFKRMFLKINPELKIIDLKMSKPYKKKKVALVDYHGWYEHIYGVVHRMDIELTVRKRDIEFIFKGSIHPFESWGFSIEKVITPNFKLKRFDWCAPTLKDLGFNVEGTTATKGDIKIMSVGDGVFHMGFQKATEICSMAQLKKLLNK